MLNFCVILAAGVLFYPTAALADRLYDGVFRVMAAGCALVLALSMPLMYLVQRGSACYACVVLGHLGITLSVSVFGAPMTAWMTQKFPVALRYSALAIAYNLSQMLFGGIAPFLATLLSCGSGYRLLGGLLFLFAAAISLTAVVVGDKSAAGRLAFIDAIEEHDKVDGGAGARHRYEAVGAAPEGEGEGVPVQRSDATRIRSTSANGGGGGSPKKKGRLAAHMP